MKNLHKIKQIYNQDNKKIERALTEIDEGTHITLEHDKLKQIFVHSGRKRQGGFILHQEPSKIYNKQKL